MWHHEWVRTVADRDAPVGDGALGVGRGSFGEGLDAVRVEERMHQREAAVEFLLRLRCAGGLKVHATDCAQVGVATTLASSAIANVPVFAFIIFPLSLSCSKNALVVSV